MQTRRVGFPLYAAHLGAIFGIALSNGLLGISTLAAPWTVERAAYRRREARPLLVAAIVYCAFVLFAVLFSLEPRSSVAQLSEIFSFGTLFLAVGVVRNEEQLRRIFDVLVLLASAMALVGLGQYLLAGSNDLEHRMRGPLSHYMTFSGVLLVADLLLLSRLLFGRRPAGLWRWLALLPINLGLLGSLTRSAWVGLAVGATALLLVRSLRLAVATVVAATLAIWLFAPPRVVARIVSIADPTDVTNYDRLCMAEAGMRMIHERPVTGLGPKLVRKLYPIYRHPTAPRYQVPHLHNSFLQLAAERGLPALASFLALLGVAVQRAMRRFREEGGVAGPRSDILLGIVLALVGFCIAGLFEDNWGDTEVQRLVLFLLAVPFCLPGRGPGALEPDDAVG